MPSISPAFFRAAPGSLVAFEGKKYEIECVLAVDSVMAKDVATDKSERLRVELLQPWTEPLSVSEAEESAVRRDVHTFSEEEWAQGQRRLTAIKPLLESIFRTREDVEKQAKESGVNAGTLYRWLKLFQQAGHVSALIPNKRGRLKGTREMEIRQEAVIQSAIEDIYLTKQRHKASDVVEEVMRRCRLAGIKPPHGNTVRNRLHDLSPEQVLRKRGSPDEARNRYSPILSVFPGGAQPLAVVQIDHTPADIILVDEVHRKPIGRPTLTLAIDVFSRMIVGLYLSFEKPNAVAVGMCLSMAICSKREYLAERSVDGEWPVWGVMSTVHCDNGKEFRGSVLQRACEEYAIDLQWRPALLPHFGGHIERLMGTMANEVRKLPGATFSNTRQRKGYNSEKEAALTLKEFEQHLLDFIVNVYHQRPHSELGMSPLRKWSQGVVGTPEQPGTGTMPLPSDPLKVKLDFMPYFLRSVQQYGIQIDNVSYYDPVLDPYINAADPENSKAKREFVVRRDPNNIAKVYFLDPSDGSYSPIPYRNIGLPAMSAWELREIQARLKAEGRKDIDEHLIFETLERMRKQVDSSVAKTKAARRQQTRIPQAPVKPIIALPSPEPPRPSLILPPSSTSKTQKQAVDDDPFDTPIVPYEEVLLTR
jgi:putative transposase